MCEKYFDIIKLLNKDIINIEDIIEIFQDFNLVNIYFLVNYYKTYIQQKNIKYEFKNMPIKNTNNLNQPEIYDTIINYEHQMNNITQINIDDIYKKLHIQLTYIKQILDKIEQYIPNYKNLFLMAIISYRNSNNLINNTWGYLNKQYIINYIKSKIHGVFIPNIRLLIYQFYVKDQLILYEYDRVTYKNQYYGNCMESIILQFLKILFWNRDTKVYNYDKIKKIIRHELNSEICKFFKNINNEKQITFINEWVKFITELPINCNKNNIYNITINYGEYNFLKPYAKVEINPTLDNLIIALKYLINNKIHNIDNEIFLSNLITSINKDFKIKIINTNKSKTVLELNLNVITYTLILVKNGHANFEESDLNKLTDRNILEHYRGKYTNENLLTYLADSDYTFSNLNAYILYLYFIKHDDIYYNYINNIQTTEKNNLIRTFFKKCISMDNDDGNYKVFYDIIINCKQIFDKDILKDILDIILFGIRQFVGIRDNYEIELSSRPDILILLSESNISNIYNILSTQSYSKKIYTTFIDTIINNNLYKLFSNNMWSKIINLYFERNKINYLFYFVSVLIQELDIVNKWSEIEYISLLNIYTNSPLSLEQKEKINILIGAINKPIESWTEYQWNNIFLYSLSYFNKPICIVIITKLIELNILSQFNNDETWENMFYMINRYIEVICSLNNSNRDRNITTQFLDIMMPLIVTKNIKWREYNQILIILIREKLINNYTNLIISNKIYLKWSNLIFKQLIRSTNPIIEEILKNNICDELSNDFWLSIFNEDLHGKYLDLISTNNVCINWSMTIWTRIINNKFFDKFINKIIDYKIYKNWNTELIINYKYDNSNTELDIIIKSLKANNYYLLSYLFENKHYDSLSLWNNEMTYNDNYTNIVSYMIKNNLCNNLNDAIWYEIISTTNFDNFSVTNWKTIFTELNKLEIINENNLCLFYICLFYNNINKHNICDKWAIDIWIIFIEHFKHVIDIVGENKKKILSMVTRNKFTINYTKFKNYGKEICNKLQEYLETETLDENTWELIFNNYIIFNCIIYNDDVLAGWKSDVWIKLIKLCILILPFGENQFIYDKQNDNYIDDDIVDRLLLDDYNKNNCNYLLNKFIYKIKTNDFFSLFAWRLLIKNKYISYFKDIIITDSIYNNWNNEIWTELLNTKEIIHFRSVITPTIQDKWTLYMKTQYYNI